MRFCRRFAACHPLIFSRGPARRPSHRRAENPDRKPKPLTPEEQKEGDERWRKLWEEVNRKQALKGLPPVYESE